MTAEFLRFAVVGLIGFVVDSGGTLLFVHLGEPPLLARVLPIGFAMLVTWLLHRTLTFQVGERPSRTELMRFAAVATSSALMNFVIYGALVLAGLPAFPAIVVATAVPMMYSFVAYRRVVFR